jgi:putative ABC transport system permease protein
MESVWLDARHGLRRLARSPLFTAVAVITLALGIGANVVVFSFVSGVLLRPFPFRDPEGLVALREARETRDTAVSYLDFVDWAASARSFSSMGAATSEDLSLSGQDTPERVSGAFATSGLFETLGVAPILGRVFLPDERQTSGRSLLLSHRLWTRRFASDPNVVGREVHLDGTGATVIGVMPAGFHFPGGAELWLSLEEGPAHAGRGDRRLSVVARRRDGVELGEARAEMKTIAARLQHAYPETNRGMTALVFPLRDLYVRQARPVLLVLTAAVLFVLAIACMNVANLLLARAAEREGEMAVRATLGASRARIVRQLVTESVLLALLGGASGLLLAKVGLDVLLASVPAGIPFWMKIEIDARVLLFTTTVSLLTGLMFGLAPALRSGRLDLSSTLKDRGRGPSGSPRSRRMQGLLVAAEIALSVVLLSGAGLLLQSFVDLQRVDPGFRPENVLTAQIAPVPESRYPGPTEVAAFYEQLVSRIERLPGVVSAAANSQIPLQRAGGAETMLVVEGTADEAAFNANVQAITPGYFQTLGIPVLRGRDFESADGALSPPVAIVNERFARQKWPDGQTIGQRLSLSGGTGPWLSIVGIVGDVRHRGLGREAMLDLYVAHAQQPRRGMTLVVRTQGTPARLADALRRECAAVDRDQPVDRVRAMTEVVEQSLWFQRFSMRLVGLFAVAAVFLAAIGLSGVVSYSVARRSQEIGLRLALGATPAHVLALVMRQGLGLVGLGVAVGVPLSAAAALGLASLLPNVHSAHAPVLLGVSVLLALVSLAACYLPARRAVAQGPAIGLRRD